MHPEPTTETLALERAPDLRVAVASELSDILRSGIFLDRQQAGALQRKCAASASPGLAIIAGQLAYTLKQKGWTKISMSGNPARLHHGVSIGIVDRKLPKRAPNPWPNEVPQRKGASLLG